MISSHMVEGMRKVLDKEIAYTNTEKIAKTGITI